MLNTIEEIKQASKDAGGHWFDADTMRFFRSRIGHKAYPVSDGAFFVTSERYDDDSPRLYTVRRAYDSGEIETVGEFQGYATLEQANTAATLLQVGQRMLDAIEAEDA